MNTYQNRTRFYNTYPTCGNLALELVKPCEFTVVEGGKQTASQSRQASVRSNRVNERAVQERMSVRMVAALWAVVITLILAWVISDVVCAKAYAKAFDGVPTTQVFVASGDCLWSIAEEHPVEGRSTRDVMTWIKEQNGLTSATLFVGQSLIVPEG